MNRRVIGLIVAFVLAAVATVAIYFYINRADERAAAEFELRQVYVATQQIPAGTPADLAISQAFIERREIPETAVAQGAIGSLDQIQGLVAVTPIVPGQQIVAANFGESAIVTSGSDIEVPAGFQAVSIDLSVIPGVAGFIDAGDRISILSLINLTPEGAAADTQPAAQPTEGATGPAEPPPPLAGPGLQARYVIQNAQVLAVGQRVITRDENGQATGKAIQESNDNYIFTLALTPVEIEKLVFAETQSTLWATLMPAVEEGPDGEVPTFEPFDTPGANADNLFQ